MRIGITHGDFNGVGYEVILKALSDDRILELLLRSFTVYLRWLSGTHGHLIWRPCHGMWCRTAAR